MNSKDIVVAAFLVLPLGLASCGGGTSTLTSLAPPPPSLATSSALVYVANSSSNDISGFAVNNLGDPGNVVGGAVLSPVPGSPFSMPSSPTGLAVDSSGSFLVVADASSKISVFQINKNTGQLTPAPGSPYPVSNQPRSLAVHTSFVYVASRGSGAIDGFQIDSATGTLSPVAGSPFNPGWGGIESIAIDQAPHDAILVAGGTGLTNFRIETDGKLTLLNSVCCSTVTSAIAARNGLLFVLSQSGLRVFNERTSGAAPDCDPLTAYLQCQAQDIQFPDGTVASSVAVGPNGRYLYVSDSASSNVNIFTINDNGAFVVSLSSYGPFQAGRAPSSIATLSNGFVYVANQLSNDISEFSIGACIIGPVLPDECGPGGTEFNVALGSPFKAGTGPTSIIATQ